MRQKILIGLLFAVCAGGSAAESLTPVAPVALVERPPDGHLEIALPGRRGAALEEGALARFLPQLRAPGFLETPALSSADPLAPCALVAAVASADLMNRIFYGLVRPGAVDLRPPPGTNILGRYDADLARGKGGIPRGEPARAADMLARVVVFRSWMISSMLNTLLAPMTQDQCLDMLMRPERPGEAMQQLKPSNIVLTHGAPVTAYITSVDHLQGREWLEALPTAQATQGECLDELFQPGRLRQKLQRAGTTLPMR